MNSRFLANNLHAGVLLLTEAFRVQQQQPQHVLHAPALAVEVAQAMTLSSL